jgi:rhodanese-related sulfurtransferase
MQSSITHSETYSEEIEMTSVVTAVPPASSERALKHFESAFEFETDCWDVQHAMSSGKADFVVFDVRGPDLFAKGHVPGAINMPHGKIVEGTMKQYPIGTIFIVYCAGPHCNGAHKGAVRLAKLGRPVKLMIGGATGWLDEGFSLVFGPV